MPEQTQIQYITNKNPIYSCGSEPERTAHFLLRCRNHVISRQKLLKNVSNLDQTIRNYDDDHLIHTAFYGSEKFNSNLNKEIIKLTACYLKNTHCFDESLI